MKFYQRHGAKRKKALPTGLSANDQKILKSVRRRAYHLDLSLSCCGFRFGWAGIIGLIPWIGDVFAAYLALLLLKKAQKIDGGLPSYIQTQMSANIAFDFGIGLIPIVGDIVNIAYKANSRNCLILESYLRHKYSKNPQHADLVEDSTLAGDRTERTSDSKPVQANAKGNLAPPQPPPRTAARDAV